MSTESKAQSSRSREETINQYGSDHWVIDQTKLRARVRGKGLFGGLQGQKRYTVERGWAKRENERDTWFLTGLWDKFWGPSSK